MGLSIIEFARLCHVSRQAVYQAVAGQLVVREKNGGIDPTHPINRTYMEMHAEGAAPPARGPAQGGARPGKSRPRRAARGVTPGPEGRPDSEPVDTDTEDDEPDEGAAFDKAFYAAKKLKLECELKEIDKAERMGQLIDRKIVAGKLSLLLQAIQSGFVDSATKQSLIVCGSLGIEGRENEVEEILSRDNQKRLEEVKRIVLETTAEPTK